MIFSIGSINADFQTRIARQFEPGETLLAQNFVRLGGGKAANRAFLANKLGHASILIGRVGDDDLAAQALNPLRRAGLALEHVTAAPHTATAVSMIAVPPDGKKTILLAANANDSWDEAALGGITQALSTAEAGALLTLDCEISPKAASHAAEAAQRQAIRIVLDPSPTDRVTPALLAAAYAIAPDAHEAGQLTGEDANTIAGAVAAARSLAAEGPPVVCVKLGDGGCILAHAGRLTHIPPVEIEVVDTTGAGDAYTGALAVALAEAMPPVEAAIFATAASHCAVMRFGSQESYPDRAEIEALIPRLSKQLHALTA